MGCDTLVALGSAARDGRTVFGKNSDRPPDECQRLVRLPRVRHPAGAVVRCQYVEIPQVRETAALLGSQPHWLWGFEHGVNEHGVAVGNEAVFAKEPLGPTGLLGMDLVRLGLERARTADEAVDVMVALIERHGQGGSGQRDVDWPYHNAFVVADPARAWILETSARHWAARPVDDVGNISNGLAIGTEWTRGSADVTAFAVARGWWTPDAGRLDFARAYGDDAGVPPNLCVGRRSRLAALLGAARGDVTSAAVRAMLRDHDDSGPIHRPRPFEDPHHFTVCMHSPGVSYTTASMVAPLATDAARPYALWACLGNPCMGPFLPIWLDVPLPEALGRGDARFEPGSVWWALHALRTLVERDVARHAPLVRARWDAFEARLAEEAAALDARGAPPRDREALAARAVADCLAEAAALVGALGGV